MRGNHRGLSPLRQRAEVPGKNVGHTQGQVPCHCPNCDQTRQGATEEAALAPPRASGGRAGLQLTEIIQISICLSPRPPPWGCPCADIISAPLTSGNTGGGWRPRN